MNITEQLKAEVKALNAQVQELRLRPEKEQFAKRLGELLAMQALADPCGLPQWAVLAFKTVAREMPAIAPMMGVYYD